MPLETPPVETFRLPEAPWWAGALGDRCFLFSHSLPEYQSLRGISPIHVGAASFGDITQYARRTGPVFDEILATVPLDFPRLIRTWVSEWTRLADRAESQAAKSRERGHLVSAKNGMLRAVNYHRMAEFLAFPGSGFEKGVNQRARSAMREVAALSGGTIETVEVAYGNGMLTGLFVHGGASQRVRPTLVLLSGFDGSAEECYFWCGRAAEERGYNMLIVNGPGHRDTLCDQPDLVFRHDYEVPVAAMIDYARKRPEVDRGKIALVGISFGGHLAARAGAFEHRIAALVTFPPFHDFHAFWKASGVLQPDHLDPHAAWVLGVRTPAERDARIAAFALGDTPSQIKCPTLVLASEGEGEVVVSQVEHFRRLLRAPHAYHLFTLEEGAAAHCALNNIPRVNQVMFDWLDEVLA